ncbi:MAG: DUF2203 domain-containing protein, partial [Gemmataceae bacterium]
MNSSPNRASNSSERSKKKDHHFDYQTAARMLPLVQSITGDVVAAAQNLKALTAEQATLEEYRRSLAWASRQRRYAVGDEITSVERTLAGATHELK